MPSDARLALQDIAENILLARQWTEGMTLETFAEDRKTFYATTRCLEIISEASRKLSDEMLDRAPQIEWREIRNAGNFYRHQYASVLESRILLTIEDRLGELDVFVRQELSRP